MYLKKGVNVLRKLLFMRYCLTQSLNMIFLRFSHKISPPAYRIEFYTVRQWASLLFFFVLFNHTLMFLAVLVITDTHQQNLSRIICN